MSASESFAVTTGSPSADCRGGATDQQVGSSNLSERTRRFPRSRRVDLSSIPSAILAIRRANLTGQIRGWKQLLNTLTMHYGDRIAAADYS